MNSVQRDTFDSLAALASQLPRPKGVSLWGGSPFEMIARMPSAAKHAAAKKVLVDWLRAQTSLEVKPFTRSASYLEINGREVALKLSMLWVGEGSYLFQQIRKGQGEFVMLFGISPETAHVWIAPANDARLYQHSQHVGRAGVANFMARIAPGAPEWGDLGGELGFGLAKLEETFGGRP